MRDIADLLERKRLLLDRRQEAGSDLDQIEEELREIDRALTQLESKEAPPTAPR